MEMTNWTCSACGLTNAGDSCRGCGGGRPNYGHHLRVLNLSSGPVFNGPVQVNVDAGDPEAALSKWFGDPEEESIQETIRNKPTSWDQITNFLIKLMFWGSVIVVGIVVTAFAFLILSGMFGVL